MEDGELEGREMVDGQLHGGELDEEELEDEEGEGGELQDGESEEELGLGEGGLRVENYVRNMSLEDTRLATRRLPCIRLEFMRLLVKAKRLESAECEVAGLVFGWLECNAATGLML